MPTKIAKLSSPRTMNNILIFIQHTASYHGVPQITVHNLSSRTGIGFRSIDHRPPKNNTWTIATPSSIESSQRHDTALPDSHRRTYPRSPFHRSSCCRYRSRRKLLLQLQNCHGWSLNSPKWTWVHNQKCFSISPLWFFLAGLTNRVVFCTCRYHFHHSRRQPWQQRFQ